MYSHIMAVEVELKSQAFFEQANLERQVRRAQLRNPGQILKATATFLTACQAGWAAYRSSIQASGHNTI
jgi:hypothetical protein